MKKSVLLKIAAAASAAALVLTGCERGGAEGGSAAPEENFTKDLTFATGGTAGVYYPLGNEYARILQDTDADLKVNAVETDGSVDNLGRIAKGDAQLGFTQSNTANDAVRGSGDFEEVGKLNNVGWMGQLYPEAAQIITLEKSGFNSVEDLKGKKIAVGAPGSGTAAVAKLILDAYGFKEGDYEPYEESFADARSKVQDGNIDASIVGSTNQISEEDGYAITKALYEDAGKISLAQGKLIKAEDALLGRGDVPLHPGAKKYFEEKGIEDQN